MTPTPSPGSLNGEFLPLLTFCRQQNKPHNQDRVISYTNCGLYTSDLQHTDIVTPNNMCTLKYITYQGCQEKATVDPPKHIYWKMFECIQGACDPDTELYAVAYGLCEACHKKREKDIGSLEGFLERSNHNTALLERYETRKKLDALAEHFYLSEHESASTNQIEIGLETAATGWQEQIFTQRAEEANQRRSQQTGDKYAHSDLDALRRQFSGQ